VIYDWVSDLLFNEGTKITSLWNHQKVGLCLHLDPKFYHWDRRMGKTTLLMLESLFYSMKGKKVVFFISPQEPIALAIERFRNFISSFRDLKNYVSFIGSRVLISRIGEVCIARHSVDLPFDPEVVIVDDLDERESFFCFPETKIIGAFTYIVGAAATVCENYENVYNPVLTTPDDVEKKSGKINESFIKDLERKQSIIFNAKGELVGTKTAKIL